MLFHSVYNLQLFLKRVGSEENRGRLEGEPKKLSLLTDEAVSDCLYPLKPPLDGTTSHEVDKA
jgi:hypothetical protein